MKLKKKLWKIVWIMWAFFENCTAAIIKIINSTNINNIIEPNNCSINFNFKVIQTLY